METGVTYTHAQPHTHTHTHTRLIVEEEVRLQHPQLRLARPRHEGPQEHIDSVLFRLVAAPGQTIHVSVEVRARGRMFLTLGMHLLHVASHFLISFAAFSR